MYNLGVKNPYFKMTENKYTLVLNKDENLEKSLFSVKKGMFKFILPIQCGYVLRISIIVILLLVFRGKLNSL